VYRKNKNNHRSKLTLTQRKLFRITQEQKIINPKKTHKQRNQFKSKNQLKNKKHCKKNNRKINNLHLVATLNSPHTQSRILTQAIIIFLSKNRHKNQSKVQNKP
jgi:hypothetical protein